jgi:uncharacterized RmlC-like cupin family protein
MTSTATKPSCRVIRGGGSTYHGKQGFDYFMGVSADTAGATRICMHMLTIPPGERAKAHLHEHHETALYVLSGVGGMWYGENLDEYLTAQAGDYVYIPAGVPHLPENPSPTDPCVAILARTDPNEQESVVLRPDLNSLVPSKSQP